MARKNESPQKAAMREMMRSYLKENDISIKNGTDVNAVMRDMMSVILEDVLDEELNEELGYSKYDYRNKDTDNNRNATPEEIDRIQALCDQVRDMIHAGENYGEKDRELHTLIASCTRNSVIPNLIPILNEAIPLFIDITRQSVKMETIQTHQAVVDAIRARDGQAAYDAMWQHLEDNKRSIEAIPDHL